MSVTTRGVKNAFRNTIRSISITAILALTIALALVMLLSLKAVQARIDDVKASVGNTVTVMPAGARGFQGGGEPLTQAEITKIENTAHVKSVTSTFEDRWVTEGTDAPTGPNGEIAGTTSLQSAIDPGTLGNRNNGNTEGGATVGGNFPDNFVLPITVTGTTAPTSTAVSGVGTLELTAGETIDGTSSDNVALVGNDLATKNNLSVGSTFTAYGQTITVNGIYDTGNTFANGGVIMPLPALQKLSSPGRRHHVGHRDRRQRRPPRLHGDRAGEEARHGADVVSDASGSADTMSSLDNVKTIAGYSLVGALVAGLGDPLPEHADDRA